VQHRGWQEPGEFFESYEISFSPRVLPLSFHLWFLGFLFAYSLMALPLFVWPKKGSGRRVIAWLGRLSERRGGILVFILPLVLVRFILPPVGINGIQFRNAKQLQKELIGLSIL
jgi:hypothetical protein